MSRVDEALARARAANAEVVAPQVVEHGGVGVRLLPADVTPDQWTSGTFRSLSDLIPSFRPVRFGMRNISCTEGRRRSPSISSTCRLYDSLSVSARFTAVSVFPSPGNALAIITTLMPCSAWAR